MLCDICTECIIKGFVMLDINYNNKIQAGEIFIRLLKRADLGNCQSDSENYEQR